MIRTDGTPTVAWARLPLLDRDPGDETTVEDRFLIDGPELSRRIAQARREGYAEGFERATTIARELTRRLNDAIIGHRVDI